MYVCAYICVNRVGNKTQKVIRNFIVSCESLFKLTSQRLAICTNICKSRFKLIHIFIIVQERNVSDVNFLLFIGVLFNYLTLNYCIKQLNERHIIAHRKLLIELRKN